MTWKYWLPLVLVVAWAGSAGAQSPYPTGSGVPTITNWSMAVYDFRTGPYPGVTNGVTTGPYMVVKCRVQTPPLNGPYNIVFRNVLYYYGNGYYGWTTAPTYDGTLDVARSFPANTTQDMYYIIPMSMDQARGWYELQIGAYVGTKIQTGQTPFTSWSHQFGY